MRGVRSLLVLLVLAVGLGAYIYFVEAERDLSDPTTKKSKAFTVDTSKVEEIEVRAINGDTTTIKKNGTDWQITAPAGVETDATAVNSLVSSLESLEVQSVVDENPASVKEYGLDPVRFTVAFKVAGDSSLHRLNLGEKTVTGGDLYARIEGQPRLFLISAFLEDSLNRTTFDLRDKTALKLQRDSIDGVTIEATGNPTLGLARKGTDWRLTIPVDSRADANSVDGLVGRVSQLQMTSLVTPDGTAMLKTYGLDKPQLVATMAAGSTRATLAIGTAKEDGSLYARDLSRPMIFTVEKALLDDLKKNADDLRVKDVFEFRSFTATGLDVTGAGIAASFAKEKAPAPAPAADPAATPPSDTWKQTKPAPKDVNQTAMTDLLNTISALRAEKFTDKAPTSGEDMVIVARFGEAAAQREERVTLRKAGGLAYAIRPGEPGAAIVPVADFDKAVTQLKELTSGK
jgi:hypothetical protein